MEWDRIGEQVRQEHDGLRKQLDGLETLACRVLVDELRLVG